MKCVNINKIIKNVFEYTMQTNTKIEMGMKKFCILKRMYVHCFSLPNYIGPLCG